MSEALLAIQILIDQNVQLILILVIGSAIGITILANFLGLADELPKAFRIPKPIFRGIISPILIVFVGIMSFEVMSIEQDMRTEGAHGILPPRVLGLNARPARLFDLEEKQEPFEAKLLGGTVICIYFAVLARKLLTSFQWVSQESWISTKLDASRRE
jgi:hypothetical protein